MICLFALAFLFLPAIEYLYICSLLSIGCVILWCLFYRSSYIKNYRSISVGLNDKKLKKRIG